MPSRLILIAILVFMLAPCAFANPRTVSVQVAWEDTLAVVVPEIETPFSEETKLTLHSGLPVALDIEIQFIRTGYVWRKVERVIVQYNVWTGRYRALTPIGPLALHDYETLLTLIRRDLVIVVPRRELPGDSEWYVKVRAGERRVLRDEDSSADAMVRIEEELSGIAGWLFRRGKQRETYGDWSELSFLPPYHESEDAR